MGKYPINLQLDAADCGPACLKMISRYYEKEISLERIRTECSKDRQGASMTGLSKASEKLGFKSLIAEFSFSDLITRIPLPCIAFWRNRHFIVVYEYKNGKLIIGDPAHGKITYTEEEFKNGWLVPGQEKGVALILENDDDHTIDIEDSDGIMPFKFLVEHIKPHYKGFLFVFLLISIGIVFQLLIPYLTQRIVDIGIAKRDLNLILLLLFGQLALHAGRLMTDLSRSWILLKVGFKINFKILSHFLSKIMRLPVSYFDSNVYGDITQRFNDHYRVEQFFTSNLTNVFLSFTSLVVFSVMLGSYNKVILMVFLVMSAIYLGWLAIFMKKRRTLDYKRFDQLSITYNSTFQIISGIKDIKLNNAEVSKIHEWQNLQQGIFKIREKGLEISQYQNIGGAIINELKNILITFLSAQAVINSEITLGMMIAIQYLIGQLNVPLAQVSQLIQSTQDMKISLERINDIHQKEDEEKSGNGLSHVGGDIRIKDLSFKYSDNSSEPVLQNISTIIPQGKVTAIVGRSGSGKSTLLKLLMKFYAPSSGSILIGEDELSKINIASWRSHCSGVLQDGFIFSDSIERNVTVFNESVDDKRLRKAVSMANMDDFVNALALNLKTKIGAEGQELSQGQKQKILMARAFYKNSKYVFLDEATNSLDTESENIIVNNLKEFVSDKTVVLIAHRLSTVKHADKIIVIDKGLLTEEGTHDELIDRKGKYFDLIKKQL